jgi:hypothetical protein
VGGAVICREGGRACRANKCTSSNQTTTPQRQEGVCEDSQVGGRE